jgi:hypothetical protein
VPKVRIIREITHKNELEFERKSVKVTGKTDVVATMEY